MNMFKNVLDIFENTERSYIVRPSRRVRPVVAVIAVAVVVLCPSVRPVRPSRRPGGSVAGASAGSAIAAPGRTGLKIR